MLCRVSESAARGIASLQSCRDLVQSTLRNVGTAPGGEYRDPPLVIHSGIFSQPTDLTTTVAGHEQLPTTRRWTSLTATPPHEHDVSGSLSGHSSWKGESSQIWSLRVGSSDT